MSRFWTLRCVTTFTCPLAKGRLWDLGWSLGKAWEHHWTGSQQKLLQRHRTLPRCERLEGKRVKEGFSSGFGANLSPQKVQPRSGGDELLVIPFQSPEYRNGTYTPENYLLEPENTPFGKGESSANHQFVGSMLVFGGVHIVLKRWLKIAIWEYDWMPRCLLGFLCLFVCF